MGSKTNANILPPAVADTLWQECEEMQLPHFSTIQKYQTSQIHRVN